jgi:hypothetical protein
MYFMSLSSKTPGHQSSSEQDGEGERDKDDEKTPDTAKRTIHFLGNPGITHDPSFMPSLNVLPELAPETNTLFHGSNVINRLNGLILTLDSFPNYGPIIMRGSSLILEQSYLSASLPFTIPHH